MEIIVSNCIIDEKFGCGSKTNLRIVEYAQGRRHYCPVCGEECLPTTVGRKNNEFAIKYLNAEEWEISRFSDFAKAWGN